MNRKRGIEDHIHPKLRGGATKHRVETALRFFGPLIAAAVYLYTLRVLLDDHTFSLLLATMAAEFFPPSSIEFAVPIGHFLGLSYAAIIIALTFQNVMAALFITWNYHLLFHLPRVGILFVRFRDKMKKFVKKNHLTRHATIFALFIFFILPFKGTGSVSMAFIGKLINVEDWKIILISIIGTVFVSAVILLSLAGLGIFADKVW